MKTLSTAYCFWCFGGFLGCHRCYLDDPCCGIAFALTGGGCGIGCLLDGCCMSDLVEKANAKYERRGGGGPASIVVVNNNNNNNNVSNVVQQQQQAAPAPVYMGAVPPMMTPGYGAYMTPHGMAPMPGYPGSPYSPSDGRGDRVAGMAAGAAPGTKFCSDCGTRNPAAARFCGGCGATTGGAAPSAIGAAPALAAPSAPAPVVVANPIQAASACAADEPSVLKQ